MVHGRVRGDDHDAHRRVDRPELGQDLEPGTAGQLDVADEDVVRLPSQRLDGSLGGLDRVDVHAAVTLERDPQELGGVEVVLDHEHLVLGFGHGPP
ncbi:Uncharacterised protein [Mycobacteroides abscessus]|nr:Uncharacterised protein [Mycobacteroides abscessus]